MCIPETGKPVPSINTVTGIRVPPNDNVQAETHSVICSPLTIWEHRGLDLPSDINTSRSSTTLYELPICLLDLFYLFILWRVPGTWRWNCGNWLPNVHTPFRPSSPMSIHAWPHHIRASGHHWERKVGLDLPLAPWHCILDLWLYLSLDYLLDGPSIF